LLPEDQACQISLKLIKKKPAIGKVAGFLLVKNTFAGI